MQSFQSSCRDLAGFKRQHPTPYDFDEILKKVKVAQSLRMQDPQPTKMLYKPFTYSQPTLNSNLSSSLNWEHLKPLLMINQSQILQQYLQLLTLNHYVQQRSILSTKRENSVSSCTTASSHTAVSPVKVPIILKKPEPTLIGEVAQKFEGNTLHKKSSKVSACKNYIALLCTGFARSILTASPGSEITVHLQELILQEKTKYGSFEEKSDQELKEFFLEHIYKDICGKKVKKMNKGRDFKVRNTEELEWLLNAKEEESDLIKFRKNILKAMVNYFFVSKYYMEWLQNGMINDANRNFFLKNKEEIQKKFESPTSYKPHFDYN